MSRVLSMMCLALALTSATACKKDSPAASKDADKDEEKKDKGKESSDKPGAAIDSATFTKHYPAVGDKETSKKVSNVIFKGSISPKKGKTVDIDNVEDSVTEKTEECLEVKDKGCVKLKVTYKLDEKTTKEGSKDPKTKTEPNSGKTYIVVRGKDPKITTEDGKDVPRDVADSLQKAYSKPDESARMLNALPEKVKVGDELGDLAKAFADIATESENIVGTPKTTCKITVKEIKQVDGKTVVVLSVDLTAEAEDKRMGMMTIGMKGTMDVAADGGMALASDVTGPISITFKDADGKLSGTMSEKEKSSYDFKK
ncbi:MAG: hypothetical protein U0271_40970 [Polyangiaceae bacterium]